MKLVEPWDTGPEVPNNVWDCSGGMDLVLLQGYGIIYSKALAHLQNLLDGDGMLKISSSCHIGSRLIFIHVSFMVTMTS